MKTRFFAGIGFALATLLSLSPRVIAQQGSGGYQARVWDVDVTIPPGAYRATKPIELDGKFLVQTQPGTFIEGVSFQGKKGDQRWKIEGTQFRKVHIGGQLGLNVEAADSVFEDCELSKDTSWFVSWWGTRWKFDNCIFTQKFMRGDLPVNDYSVKATRCTFYNIKLPSIGVKENAAGYMQKDVLFDSCRFVQCEVTETLLAATVGCVFESCQFQAKRHTWPKETKPIKVSAYFGGSGGTPASFLNGPLGVQFAPVPKDAVLGVNLPHTQSGGRVTVTSFRLSGQFAALGNVPKNASEIPNVAAPEKTAAPIAPAQVAAPPAAGAAGAAVRALDDLVRTMPATISLMSAGQLNIAGVEAANEWLEKNCAGRPAELRMILDVVKATKDDGYVNQALSRDQAVLVRGATVPGHIVALFRSETAAPLARALKGADLPVRGVVKKAEFVGRGTTVELVLTVGEAHTP